MFFQLPAARTITFTLWSVFAVGLIAISTIIFVGTFTERTVDLTASPVIASKNSESTQQFYSARLRGFFRGNDLFCVSSARILLPAERITSEQWDVNRGKGQVLFSSVDALKHDQVVPVAYKLVPRWSKILPAVFRAFLFFAAAQMCLSAKFLFELTRQKKVNVLAVPAMIALLLACIVAIVYEPGWIYGDSHFILNSTVQGEPAMMAYFPHIGRFYPMAYVDLNLLIPFGDSPFAYHVERSILFTITFIFLLLVFRKLTNNTIAGLLVLMFLTAPSLFRVHAESIYAEAVIAPLLAVFFYCYVQSQQTGNQAYLVVAGMVAVFASYCKEPMFGLFGIFALVHLIFGFASLNRALRNFNLFLIINGAIFVAAYMFVCSGAASSYADAQSARTGISRIMALKSFASAHVLVPVAMTLGLLRLPFLFSSRTNQWLTFDAALYSGTAYVFALALLRLSLDYLAIPAYVCWTFALGGYIQCGLRYRLSRTRDEESLAKEISPRELASFSPWAKPLVALSLAIITFQFVTPISDIRTYQNDRDDTKVLSDMFTQLREEGYAMYVVYPPNDGRKIELLDWRRTVLNIFDSSFRKKDIDEESPFEAVSIDDSRLNAKRCIAIFDCHVPNADAIELALVSNGFKPVEQAPYCMGAFIYTKHEQMIDVNKSLSVARKSPVVDLK